VSRGYKKDSPDGQYLADIAVITSASKIKDDEADKNSRIPMKYRKKIYQAEGESYDSLKQINVPVDDIRSNLVKICSCRKIRPTESI
jgi:hypothetical protein